MSNKIVYHYIIRYTFVDKKKHEIGHGSTTYDTVTRIKDSPFDLLAFLEKEIAYSRKHEEVFISCYYLLGAELLS